MANYANLQIRDSLNSLKGFNDVCDGEAANAITGQVQLSKGLRRFIEIEDVVFALTLDSLTLKADVGLGSQLRCFSAELQPACNTSASISGLL